MKNKILFSFIVLAGMAVSSAMAQVLPGKQETLKNAHACKWLFYEEIR